MAVVVAVVVAMIVVVFVVFVVVMAMAVVVVVVVVVLMVAIVVMAAVLYAWLVRAHGVTQLTNGIGQLVGVGFLGLVAHRNRAMLNRCLNLLHAFLKGQAALNLGLAALTMNRHVEYYQFDTFLGLFFGVYMAVSLRH